MGPTESTQLKELLAHLSGRLDEFNDKVGPVVQIFKDMRSVEGDDVVEYLRVKQQLLLPPLLLCASTRAILGWAGDPSRFPLLTCALYPLAVGSAAHVAL